MLRRDQAPFIYPELLKRLRGKTWLQSNFAAQVIIEAFRH